MGQSNVGPSIDYGRGDSMIFWISWAAVPAGQGPCGVDKGRSLVVK